MARRLPTDLKVLEAIFERYYRVFTEYYEGRDTTRESKVYVPIDVEIVARDLDVDPDLLFARLYHHLQGKYGYEKDGASVPFFSLAVGKKDRHCVHFPYLASVLATMRDEQQRHDAGMRIALVSLVLSIVSIVITLWRG
jgi:hypothetical protein